MPPRRCKSRGRRCVSESKCVIANVNRAMADRTGHAEHAQVPIEDAPVKIDAAKTVAAGLPAVVESARHAVKEMGVARTLRVLSDVNQHDGFDCTSCAWPDPAKPSVVEFCENGAKATAAAATKKTAGSPFFAKWTIDELVRQSDMWLGKQGRLSTPLILRDRRYQPISWEAAFTVVADHLHALASPDEAVFYTSGRTSNEAAFLYQLFARRFGTNNLPDCSNMCHESSGMGLSEVIGVGKGTVTLEDFEHAELIFIVGQNPGTNHPRMLSTLETAKKHGARIVHVNPLREAGLVRFKHPQKMRGYLGTGTPLADVFLQVRINGDVALLKGFKIGRAHV